MKKYPKPLHLQFYTGIDPPEKKPRTTSETKPKKPKQLKLKLSFDEKKE